MALRKRHTAQDKHVIALLALPLASLRVAANGTGGTLKRQLKREFAATQGRIAVVRFYGGG